MQKLVSIITVVYNNKIGLEETIKSVINQSYKNFEYIVIDGASTDGTLDIITKYNKHIKTYISEPDKGIYDAMNKGVNLSKGKYIYFLNSGDYFINKNTLSDISKYFERNYDVICGNILRIHSNLVYTIKPNENGLKYGNMWPHQAMFMNKTSIDNMGGFDLNYKIAADFDLLCKLYSLPNFNYLLIDNDIAYMPSGGIGSTDLSRRECSGLVLKYFGIYYAIIHSILGLRYKLERLLKSILIYLGLEKIYILLLKMKLQKQK